MKKYIYSGLTALSVVAISIVLFFVLQNMEMFRKAFGAMINILMPVIYGAVIAYLLSPLYNWLREKLQKLFSQKGRTPTKGTQRAASALAILISMAALLAVVAGLLAMIIPELVRSITNLLDSFSMSDNYVSFTSIVHTLVPDDQLAVEINKLYTQFEQNVQEFIQNYITPYLQNFFDYLSVGLCSSMLNLRNFAAILCLKAAIFA